MRNAIRLAWLTPCLLALVLAGCTVEAGPPPGAVVVGPGYYYDEAYVDTFGVYHPRAYWYRDDHGWVHTDRVPVGFAARDRAGFGYVHGAPPRGREDRGARRPDDDGRGPRGDSDHGR